MKKFIKIGDIRIVLEFERGYAIKGGGLECPNT